MRSEQVAGATASRMATPLSLLAAPRRAPASLKISGAGAQLVHIHLPNPAAVLSYLASGYQGRFVVTYHSDTVRERFLGYMFEPLLHVTLRRCSAIIATSMEYVRTSPILADYLDRCHVIPYGIDLERFSQCEISAVAGIREQHGERLILSAGHLVHYKGFEVLIRSMKHVRGKLLIAGDGPLRAQLAQITAKLNLQHKVCFLGELRNEQVASYYHACGFAQRNGFSENSPPWQRRGAGVVRSNSE